MTPSSNSSQSTRPIFGKNYSTFLDFTGNYERTSGIFVPCNITLLVQVIFEQISSIRYKLACAYSEDLNQYQCTSAQFD